MTTPPDTTTPVTFTEHVRSLLEREITEGRLAGGQRVREVELATMLGVSRTPVREALRTLERDGLVIRPRGRGTYIAPPLEPDEVLVLYSVRLAIEPFLAGRAAARLAAARLETIVAAQADFREIVTVGGRPDDVRALLAADTRIHLTMYLDADSRLATVVESYWARTVRERSSFFATGERKSLLAFADGHDRIIDALRRRDTEETTACVRKHLEEGVAILRRRTLREDPTA